MKRQIEQLSKEIMMLGIELREDRNKLTPYEKQVIRLKVGRYSMLIASYYGRSQLTPEQVELWYKKMLASIFWMKACPKLSETVDEY